MTYNRGIYNVLDLFCGAGGMSEGFIQAGFHVPFASDFSKEASLTYKNRHQQLGYDLEFHEGDVTELTPKKKIIDFISGTKIDVIVGGPPCQGFSLTGKRGKEDPRNKMFLEFLKIVKSVKPKYFVMENVEGILSYIFDELKGVSGKVYQATPAVKIIIEESLRMGYRVQYLILNAKDYGVPQNRSRVIFFGNQVSKKNNSLIDIVPRPTVPKKMDKIVTVQEAISDLSFLKNGQTSKQYDDSIIPTPYQLMLRNGVTPSFEKKGIQSQSLFNHTASLHVAKTINRFQKLEQGETIGDLLKRIHTEEYEELYTKKYRCKKLHEDSVSPTVLTLPDDIVHYDKNNPRILTVREFARLQSFDDSFEFHGKRTTGGKRRRFETPQYTQVGNAVPPLFARAIAISIKSALDKEIIHPEEGVVLEKSLVL